jgi:carbonic anhydrase
MFTPFSTGEIFALAPDTIGHDQRRPPSRRDAFQNPPVEVVVLKGHSDMTTYTPELIQRNAAFAASGAFKGLPFPTNPGLRVIGCVDSRVDPSDVLGLKIGEAVVMRTNGGRVTPEALRSWALLAHLGAGGL